MLYLQLWFVVFFGLVEKSMSMEQDQFCQLKAIQECLDPSLGLLEAIEIGNEPLSMKECDLLQTSIGCFSVPRCPGNLLKAFRYLVLTVGTTLKKSQYACPNLDVETLEHFLDKGYSMKCEDNKSVKDICDRSCKCKNGKLDSCYRVRKEFTKMSLEERTRFIKAFKMVSSDPRYIREHERIGKVHTVIPAMETFFPWHRWYTLELENLLRQVDCRITIPYWDWSKDAEHWTRGSEIEDTWNEGPHGLGGNGVFPLGCVMNGPFKYGEYSLPQTHGNCLKRNFNYSCKLPNAEKKENILDEANYTVFRNTIVEHHHGPFHKCVGGTLAFYVTAPHSPEFWLLHSYLDKLWVKWKRRNEGSFSDLRDSTKIMVMTGHHPWEYHDEDHLPGGVKISYEE